MKLTSLATTTTTFTTLSLQLLWLSLTDLHCKTLNTKMFPGGQASMFHGFLLLSVCASVCIVNRNAAIYR